MVSFRLSMGGFNVLIDEKVFGHVSRDRGFFIGPSVVKELMEISSEDLRVIASEVDSIKTGKAPTERRDSLKENYYNLRTSLRIFLDKNGIPSNPGVSDEWILDQISRFAKKEEFAVYCAVVYRSKKDPSKYMMTTHTLSGEDISDRMKTVVTIEANSWSNEWELVNFSHSTLPFNPGGQI